MMEHLNMQSMDKVAANVAKIRELFPNCVTERINNEGKLEHAIDFDMLKQELSDHVVDGLQERYQFTWPDKRKAILAANAPINKTLRPCREESVDFDNTENLYIEGDNLEVLKLLQETYLGKVKMIYIDPPYNTGKDFVYNDDFKQSAWEYIENSGQFDEEGNRLVTNTESNGRFHTDWLNMIYPRLKLAKDLLSEDGVLCISMDENEEVNLIKLCNEIFGIKNFIGDVIRKTKTMTADNGNGFNMQHEILLIYAKNRLKFNLKGEEKSFSNYSNPDNDPNGEWCSGDPSAKSGGNTTYFGIENPYTKKVDFPPSGRYWAFSKSTFDQYVSCGKIKFKQSYSENERGFIFKRYKNSMSILTEPVNSLFAIENDFMNQSATTELKSLFDESIFSYPKPVLFINKIIKYADTNDSIILDFFSGSATTAHAVMQLNAEDGGKRKFIMVQLQEECAENSEAYKAGYKNICEIGKERIRRAGKKIKEENPLTTQDLDIGFRVLKCDSSNMEDVYFTPKEYMDKQQSLFVDNIKKDHNDEDLLFDAMLKLDTPLSSKIEKITVAGKTVYNVAQGHLMACFDKNVTDEVITAIAKEMPSYFVMRDSSQADDSVAINFEQIFNTYSPQTVRRVL